MNLNKAIIVGRVTQDPEMRTTPNGTNVATFSIATNRYWKDNQGQKQDSTEFHNIVAWSRLAEIASQYLKKGSLVMIEGRLQTRSWEGQDGVKRYRTEIVAEHLQLGPRPGTGDTSPAPPQSENEESIPTIQQDDIDSPKKQNKTTTEQVDINNIPF